MNNKQRKMIYRIFTSIILLIAINVWPLAEPYSLISYLGIYLLIGYDILRSAGRGMLNGRVFDENFLMAIATVGAFFLAIYEQSGEYLEGISVMLFYQIGEFFQSYAVGKSRKDINALMDIRPDYANIEKNGTLIQVSPEDVAIGTEIIVQPGEKIPLDGIVISGTSTLDTRALTGESSPRDIQSGEDIISGCVNMTGVLRIRTTKEFEESTAAKIMELVENSSSHKSKSEAFIAKFAKVYTPFVCYSALALALLPPIAQQFVFATTPQWETWFYRALIFLVISCPCALVISVPLTFFAGLGCASKEGILIKGSNYLETLAKVKHIVFDKTGTLTKGNFVVSGIHHNELEDKKLLEYAALAECASSHPISQSLRLAHGEELDRHRVTDIQEISGQGISASVDGMQVLVGNHRLMEAQDIPYKDCHLSGTIIHIAINHEYAGHIVISDVIKENSAQAISQLLRNGINDLIMLTGDNATVAQEVAKNLGIKKVFSQLLPGDKVAKVEEFLHNKSPKEKLAFVGDGINDAPVLTRADIGIAMGALGSDAAIEAADVVLMDDDPLQISKAIKIARNTMSIVYQNIIFALGIKFVCLFLGAIGIANMWFAIFADVGVMVLAVLNAMRALRI